MNLKSQIVVVAIAGLTIGSSNLARANELSVYTGGGVTLTTADIARIMTNPDGQPRGGTARIVECNGAYGYSTIQSAIDAATDGDVIVVLPNDCNEEGRWFEHLNMLGKSLQLQGANPDDPEIVENTVLDGGESGTIVLMHGPFPFDQEVSLKIAGLTLEHGELGIDHKRSGLELEKVIIRYCSSGIFSWPSVGNIKIVDCTIAFTGGGGFLGSASFEMRGTRYTHNLWGLEVGHPIHASIENCLFADNGSEDSPSGGGLRFNTQQGGSVVRCEFRNNLTGSHGGGLYMTGQLDTISECLFIGNKSGTGGGIYASRGTIRNCNFVGNHATAGGGITSTVPVSHCVTWFNRSPDPSVQRQQLLVSAPAYCLIQGLNTLAGNGNIDGDPMFVDPGHWDDNGTPADLTDDFFVAGDYHLLPGSPCIDAGDPAFVPENGETDIDGQPRLMGCRVDIGADEFALTNPIPGDVNYDEMVDFDDVPRFVDLLLRGAAAGCAADLNGDAAIDGADLQTFVDLVLG